MAADLRQLGYFFIQYAKPGIKKCSFSLFTNPLLATGTDACANRPTTTLRQIGVYIVITTFPLCSALPKSRNASINSLSW